MKILLNNLFLLILLIMINSLSYSQSNNKIKKNWIIAKCENTIESYVEFIKSFPKSMFEDSANANLEILYLEKYNKDNNANEYALFLGRFPNSKHNEVIREKIKNIRCSDPNLLKIFPTWLKLGKVSDSQVGARWNIGASYLGSEGKIAYGYKVIADDPSDLISVEFRSGYLIYFGGKGIIIGLDNSRVLVGYSCE